ncbi:hypothetical protein [Clostridium botulinum]|uniref:hypothetical protein n=1 Tax=Clostridium botulinum TaxID=1491 RepID=UPI00069AD3DC|nr:hypothetical protein [Clostridium botulinum]KOA88686.1 hypothetical protein ADU75_01535 [Clostridium botulinum]
MSFSDYCKQDKLEKSIAYICNCEYKYFLNKANVVGVGCGYKVKNGFYTNQLCIQVFVSRKFAQNQLSSNDMVPLMYKGIQTDVKETGHFTACSLTEKIRPTLGGYIIGNEYDTVHSGTLGCLVTDGKNLFILSNNHVLASTNFAPLGNKIIQPSYAFGGDFKTDVVAILSKFIPIKFEGIIKAPSNYADCAIAKVINKSLVSPRIAFVGIPQEPIVPRLDQSIKKVGYSTELTSGIIIGINATAEVHSATTEEKFLFKEQIVTTNIGSSGDSGALLLDPSNHTLGLLMSGCSSRNICNPIKYILKELDVRIVTS